VTRTTYCPKCPCADCLEIRLHRNEDQQREDARDAAYRALNHEHIRERRKRNAFRTIAQLIMFAVSDADRRATSKILVAALREIDSSRPANMREAPRYRLPQYSPWRPMDGFGRAVCDAFMIRLNEANAIAKMGSWTSTRMDDVEIEDDFDPPDVRRKRRFQELLRTGVNCP
jgi:hypothetical protein